MVGVRYAFIRHQHARSSQRDWLHSKTKSGRIGKLRLRQRKSSLERSPAEGRGWRFTYVSHSKKIRPGRHCPSASPPPEQFASHPPCFALHGATNTSQCIASDKREICRGQTLRVLREQSCVQVATTVERCQFSAMPHSQKITEAAAEPKRPFICALSRAVEHGGHQKAAAGRCGRGTPTVRSNTSTTVRGAGATRESVGASTSVRERSSGAGNAGARSGGQGARKRPPAAPVAADPPKIGNRYRRRGRQPLALGLLARASGCSGARAGSWRNPEQGKVRTLARL